MQQFSQAQRSGRLLFLMFSFLAFFSAHFLAADEGPTVPFSSIVDDLCKSKITADKNQKADTLSEQRILQTCFQNLSGYTHLKIREDVAVLARQLYVLLGHANRPERTVLNQIGQGRLSACEQIEMARVLTHPETDPEVLQKRQAAVRLLTEQPGILQKINETASVVQRAESAFGAYWLNPAMAIRCKQFYFNSWRSPLNRNQYALLVSGNPELYDLFKKGILYPLAIPFAFVLLAVGLKGIMNYPHVYKGLTGFKEVPNIVKTTLFSVYNLKDFLTGGKGIVKLGLSFINGAEKAPIVNDILQMPPFRNAVCYFFIVRSLYRIKNIPQRISNDVCPVYEHLVKVADIVKAYDAYREVVQAHPELSEAIQGLGGTVQEPQQSAQFKLLLSLLRSDMFKAGKGSFGLLFNTGNILKAHKLMNECKQEFVPLLSFVAKIGVLRTTVQLYKSHQQGAAQFCFPRYLTGSDPVINVDGAWSPLVGKEESVPNSCSVRGEVNGSSNSAALLLTGSNRAGKSTYLRALASAVYLGQTLSISSAQDAAFSPMDLFGISLSITDDPGFESLYSAEIKSLQQLYSLAVKSKKNEKALLVVDEPFKGTGADKASSLFERYIKEVVKNGGSKIVLCATHFFEAVKKLSEENPNQVHTGRFDAKTDEHGKISFPFKYEDGKISENNIAEEMAQEIFVTD